MWMTFSCLFMSIENSPFLLLSCFPSKFSSYRKVAFWCYLLVPAVTFFFSAFLFPFSDFFLLLLSPGCFIHPSCCAELFPFLITYSSDAPHLILLTQPNAYASGNSALKTQFSLLIQCPGWLPRPSSLYGGSTCRKCYRSFGTAWAFSLRKYLKLWNACWWCTWNSANLKKSQDVLLLACDCCAKVPLKNSTGWMFALNHPPRLPSLRCSLIVLYALLVLKSLTQTPVL